MTVTKAVAERLSIGGHVSATDRHLLGYTTVAHALDHAVMLSIPLFVLIWMSEFGMGSSELGLLVTVMAGLFGVTALPAGQLSDRFGADRLITAFLIATGVALLLVPAIDSFLGLVLALVGAVGLYHPPALSLISREADEPSKGFAYHGLGANVGIGLGPLLVTVGLAFAPWRVVLALLAVPLAAFGILFWWLGPDDHPDDPEYTTEDASLLAQLRPFVKPAFAAIVLMYVAGGLYYRGVLTFLPEFLNSVAHLPALSLGAVTFEAGRWVYSAVLLVGSVGQIVGGNLGERFGPEPVLVGVFVTTSAALLGLSVVSGAGVLLAGAAFGALLFTLAPLQSTLVANYVPAASQGLGFGLVFAINFGIGSAGASLAGFVLESSTFSRLFRLFAVLPIVALLAVVAVDRLAEAAEN